MLELLEAIIDLFEDDLFPHSNQLLLDPELLIVVFIHNSNLVVPLLGKLLLAKSLLGLEGRLVLVLIN